MLGKAVTRPMDKMRRSRIGQTQLFRLNQGISAARCRREISESFTEAMLLSINGNMATILYDPIHLLPGGRPPPG